MIRHYLPETSESGNQAERCMDVVIKCQDLHSFRHWTIQCPTLRMCYADVFLLTSQITDSQIIIKMATPLRPQFEKRSLFQLGKMPLYLTASIVMSFGGAFNGYATCLQEMSY